VDNKSGLRFVTRSYSLFIDWFQNNWDKRSFLVGFTHLFLCSSLSDLIGLWDGPEYDFIWAFVWDLFSFSNNERLSKNEALDFEDLWLYDLSEHRIPLKSGVNVSFSSNDGKSSRRIYHDCLRLLRNRAGTNVGLSEGDLLLLKLTARHQEIKNHWMNVNSFNSDDLLLNSLRKLRSKGDSLISEWILVSIGICSRIERILAILKNFDIFLVHRNGERLCLKMSGRSKGDEGETSGDRIHWDLEDWLSARWAFLKPLLSIRYFSPMNGNNEIIVVDEWNGWLSSKTNAVHVLVILLVHDSL